MAVLCARFVISVVICVIRSCVDIEVSMESSVVSGLDVVVDGSVTSSVVCKVSVVDEYTVVHIVFDAGNLVVSFNGCKIESERKCRGKDNMF